MMTKNNKTNTMIMLLLMWYVMTLNAQTKIWGVGSGINEAEAEFNAGAFVATTVASNYNPTTWTALHVSQTGGASPAAYWTRSLLGYSQGQYAPPNPTPMPSPSQANGVAIFDSDYLNVIPISGGPHRGELISPRIDLTGYSNQAIIAQFYSEYKAFNITELSVGLSTDDGATWTAIDYRALQADESPSFVRVLFNSTVMSGSNLSQCRLRFVFEGNSYYAMVDDISIELAPKYDLAIRDANHNHNALLDASDFVKIGGNAYFQLNNIMYNPNLLEWFWGARVVNHGTELLLPAANPKMYMTIDYRSNGFVSTDIYRDTILLDTIPPNNFLGVAYTKYLDHLNWVSSYRKGRYDVTYWLEHDSLDYDLTNDTVRYSFFITEQYQSKAGLDSVDNHVRASSAIFPDVGPFQQCEYGSIFYFPQGTTNSIGLDSLDFRYYITDNFAGVDSQLLLVRIYELDPSQGVLNNSLLTEVGVGALPVNGLGTTVSPGNYGLATAHSFFHPQTGAPVGYFKNNSFYYISVTTLASFSGLSNSTGFTIDDVPICGVDEYNYLLNNSLSRADTLIGSMVVSVTDTAGNKTWITSTTAPVVPSIGLYLSLPTYSSVTKTEGLDDALSIGPNPVYQTLNLSIDLQKKDDITYIITDMQGRVWKLFDSLNVDKEQQSLDVSALPSGVYTITVRTENKTISEHFTKQ